MRGGSLTRYVPPSTDQDGSGLESILTPAKEIVRKAWADSVEAIGGPQVLKTAAKTFKKSATRGVKRTAAAALANNRHVKRARNIFG